MYPYHSTTSLTLRAKLSFSNNHHLSIYNNDNCSYCYASQPPTLFYTAPRNPRFIYYGYLLRREASLFQFESSRTFVLPRRGARVCDEAIGLLEEKERRCCCCCRCCGGEGFRSGDGSLERSSRKEGSWKGNFGKSLKKEGSWSGDEERFSRKEKIRNGEGGGGSRRSDYTSVKKSSFLRDAEEKGVERRRVVGESSSRGGRKKDYGVSRVDVEEKVVREVRNLEGDVKFGRDSRHEKRNEFVCLKGSAREAREESVYKEPERSRRQIGIHARDESTNNSSSRREDYDLRIWDEEENLEDRRDTGREAKEESVYKEQEKSRMQQGFHGRDGRSKVSSSRKEVYDLRIRDEEENVEDWMDSRRIEREGYVQEDKLNRSSVRDRYSNYRNESSVRNVDKGESSTSFVSLQSEVDQKAVNQAELRKSSFRESNIERVSTSQRHFEEEKVKNREGRFGSVTNLVEGSRDERTQNDRRTIERMELNRQYETHHRDSRFHLSDKKGANSSESYVEIKGYNGSSSSSRRHIEEERVKDREDRFNSVKNVVQVLEDERIESNEQKETDRIDSRIHLSDKERANTSGSYVEIKVSDGISSSLQKRQDEEGIKSREDRATKTENLIQLRRDERTQVSQQSIDKTEFDEQNENQTIPSKIYVSGNESVNNKKSSVQIRTDERINLQEMSTTRIDNQKETSSQMKETQVSIGSFHGGPSSALESANRLDESSATYVGEFVNKLRQETSALDSSKISKEKTVMGTNQEATIVEVSEEKYTEEGGRQSSSRSGMKGPTDEMWEIKGLSSSNQPYKIEEPEDDSTEVVGSKISPEIAENAIARRSHRSLWAYIADVMKIGWGHRARSHNSNQKPGPRSSSNDSFSSEAWFSGHEPDENDDEFKKEKDASPKELVPSKQKQLGEQSTQVDLSASLSSVRRGEEVQRGEGETRDKQMHGSGSQKPEEEFGRQKYPEVSGIEESDGILGRRNSWTKELVTKGSFVQQFHPLQSTSLGIMNTSSPSKVDFKPMEGGRRRNVTISSVDQASVSIPGIVAPSVTEIGSVKMAETGGGELEGEIIIEKVPEIGGTEERVGELKRKLQRNKQVLREQFDEWEEAYKRKIEQRKIDEFFMREALLEAKKAGDTWEVPVGAVLVQNGKIIARGCNLVEELRDSTAHAEMICIRAASNLLQSWRLAETTLYVTLEPCAMCAGAILQARMDTVVWGAPNKLLGADGSWVRLFPSGDGGTTSTLDPPNQMVGPVHPFHPKITIRRGVLATECSEVMQQFFQLRRRKKNITKPEQPSPPPSRLHVSAHPTKLFAKMQDLFCIMFCL